MQRHVVRGPVVLTWDRLALKRASVCVKLSPMGPSKEQVFCLDVFVNSVEILSHDNCSHDGNGMALACRFLDYPLFFIHGQPMHDRLPRCTFNTGKSCALAESRETLAGIVSKV